ncbi:MAG: RNA methyltransferase [Spirochaetaceae bacterium]|jgi:TrmH RNA methyltransferase|nr:RNA methyltransferase [Spirochaetaceae bacterium]
MKNTLLDELAICGLNAVKAAAEVHPDVINRLFLREDRMPLFAGICKQLAARKRPYKITGDEELEKICKTHHHQGVVAMLVRSPIVPLTQSDLDMWAEESKTGVILHDVGNDHNVGAIVRSCAFFDAHFIVLPERDREAALTTSAYRVAEGGMEYVHIRSVYRTEAFLRDASQKILIVGTAPRARRRIGDLRPLIAEKSAALGGKRCGIGFVFGNELTGLPPAVEEACSVLVRIPGSGNIESLNVSHTASIFLREAFD